MVWFLDDVKCKWCIAFLAYGSVFVQSSSSPVFPCSQTDSFSTFVVVAAVVQDKMLSTACSQRESEQDGEAEREREREEKG